MRFTAPSVRARLTLWHAGVLALVICLFSVGIFLFVKARLYRALDQQIGHDLATIEQVYREETGDLGELAHRMGITLFQVVEGDAVLYRTPDWPPSGTTPYRLGALAETSHRITVARDETALRQTNAKFERRFASIERALAALGKSPQDASLAEMDALWDAAKATETGSGK